MSEERFQPSNFATKQDIARIERLIETRFERTVYILVFIGGMIAGHLIERHFL